MYVSHLTFDTFDVFLQVLMSFCLKLFLFNLFLTSFDSLVYD